MGKFGTKNQMIPPYERPGYGGSVKPTSPDIKRSKMPPSKDQYAKDNARAEAKFNARGAERPWAPKGRAKVVSKGSCDTPGVGPSKKVGSGPGYDDLKGYKKV